MRASDNVRIRRQFRSYEKPQDEICVGDRVYCVALQPQGNSRKLQLKWSSPVFVTEIINNALVRVKEYDVKNPRTYVAHRSKVRLAKKLGQKDMDPLFKLPRLPAEAIRDLADELSEFELPARQLDAEIIDEFHLSPGEGSSQQHLVKPPCYSSRLLRFKHCSKLREQRRRPLPIFYTFSRLSSV